MRYALSIMLLFLFATAFTQKNKKARPLDQPRGHYAQLSKLSKEPRAVNASWDTLHYPYYKDRAERRTSLKPIYLTDVAWEDFKVPNPPANSSLQTREELNYLLRLQGQRTTDDERSGLYKANVYYNLRTKPGDEHYDRYRKNLFYIGRSIGSWFNPNDLPVTADFMASVWQDASYYIWSFKDHFLRIRPYVLEPKLNNLEETDWAAYPSGHAANSYINAYIYQELAPEFKDVFIKDALDMAHSREIIGVHYPSDSETSRIFARNFVNKLFEKEKFRLAFEEVKKEWQEKAREQVGR
ncbi:MAG: phosphatase [Cyclobacteriaceae bacterium]|nr:phosphatase [Cyclobacteriaceae bacterium]